MSALVEKRRPLAAAAFRSLAMATGNDGMMGWSMRATARPQNHHQHRKGGGRKADKRAGPGSCLRAFFVA